jgi:hypothetical protein
VSSVERRLPARLGTASQWDTFQRSAFRLETLPEYRVAKEEGLLERYLAGEPMPAGYNERWPAGFAATLLAVGTYSGCGF